MAASRTFLNKCLTYDPSYEGDLKWKRGPKAGQSALYAGENGPMITLGSRHYLAARIILLMTRPESRKPIAYRDKDPWNLGEGNVCFAWEDKPKRTTKPLPLWERRLEDKVIEKHPDKTRRPKVLPSIKDLQKIFRYNSITGELNWKEPEKKRKANPAGYRDPKGYLRVRLMRQSWFTHRIAWALYYKEDPGDIFIDHIDRNPSNNRIRNLRLVDAQGNALNRTAKPTTSASGFRGVAWIASRGKWLGYVDFKRKRKSLGYHDTAEQASYWVERHRAEIGLL